MTFGLAVPAMAQGNADRLGPTADHHQHLMSPNSAALVGPRIDIDRTGATLSPAVEDLIKRRVAAWNSPKDLVPLYTDDVVLLEDSLVKGPEKVAEQVGTRFGRPYALRIYSSSGSGDARHLIGEYTPGDGDARTIVGTASLTLVRDGAKWKIASEYMRFPGKQPLRPLDSATLIKLLDEASIDRAVVLSLAYFYESPHLPGKRKGPAMLRAENDWTAAEVAKFPNRLVAFCSVNPLTATALPEMARCAEKLNLRGLKLHFGNSNVDLKKPEHLAQMKRIFAEANRLRMPVVVHLWSSDNQYGAKDTTIFLDEILPQSPDIVVQVAHMAGAGPGWDDPALAPLAEAVERKDPRTKNLYFDIATAASDQPRDALDQLAKRIRQIGPERILYGSDGAFAGNATPDVHWGHFRGMVPLTDQELAVIRDNVAPYLR